MGIFDEDWPVLGKAEAEVTNDGLLAFFQPLKKEPQRTFYLNEPQVDVEDQIRWPRASYQNRVGMRLFMDELTPNQQREQLGFATFWEAHGLVPYEFRMNPETDDVIFSDKLEPGMVILSESDRMTQYLAAANLFGAKLTNRWCKVIGEVRIDEDKYVHFVGEYRDGLKSTWHVYRNKGWFVKKDSIPVSEDELPLDEN